MGGQTHSICCMQQCWTMVNEWLKDFGQGLIGINTGWTVKNFAQRKLRNRKRAVFTSYPGFTRLTCSHNLWSVEQCNEAAQELHHKLNRFPSCHFPSHSLFYIRLVTFWVQLQFSGHYYDSDHTAGSLTNPNTNPNPNLSAIHWYPLNWSLAAVWLD